MGWNRPDSIGRHSGQPYAAANDETLDYSSARGSPLMRTAIILAFVVLTGTGGEIALTHAMKRLGEMHQFSPSAIARFLLRALEDAWLWIAGELMAVSFYAFLADALLVPGQLRRAGHLPGLCRGGFRRKISFGRASQRHALERVTLICLSVALAWVNKCHGHAASLGTGGLPCVTSAIRN